MAGPRVVTVSILVVKDDVAVAELVAELARQLALVVRRREALEQEIERAFSPVRGEDPG
jgi:hypothetical protein